MAEAHDWYDPSAQNLDPALLQAIMAVQAQADPSGNGLMRYYVDPKTGRSFLARANWDQTGVGEGSSNANTASNWGINEDLGGRYGRAFDAQGNYAGNYKSQGPWQDFLTAAAIVLGGYYGGTYLSEAGAAGGAGGTASGVGGGAGAGGGAGGAGAAGASSITLPTTAEVAAGVAPASASTAATVMPAINIAGGGITAGQALAAASAAQQAMQQGGNDGGDFRAQERGGYQTDGRMPTSPATTSGNMDGWDTLLNGIQQFLGNGAGNDPNSWANIASRLLGGNAGGLLGGLAGYLDGKDGKQITQQTAPWEPAQPYIKGLFSEGADLYGRQKQQPFSLAEQAAYSNAGNVLDFINGNAPGLLDGFQANASGANQFSRNDPRRPLIGSSYNPATSPVAWRPQLLGDFGTSGTGLLRR